MKFKTWLENSEEWIASAKARFKKLRSLQEPLATKGNLTAEEATQYKKLTDEMHDIMFALAKPLTIEKISPADMRKSTLSPEVVMTAQHDLLKNKEVYTAITTAAAGVNFNANTPVDDIIAGRNPKVSAEDLFQTFSATREALKKQYGEFVPAYRATGQQKTKPTENWATTPEFATQFGSNVIQKNIPINKIVAVNVGLKGNYHELIVNIAK